MNPPTFRALAGPVLILALLTVAALYARPMTPIDETRYVGVAWEMWLKDEYLVLFKNGEPYSHKPPLLFWLYNLGWAVFGVNEWWPRLVSPLFSLAGLLLTAALARRLWPEDAGTGHNALWVLASGLLWIVFSTSAMFDVMLAFFVLLGMRGLLIAAEESRRRGFAWLAVAIGLGVLAKGPVVLLHLLPVALLAPWWRGSIDGAGGWKGWYLGILLAVLGGAAIALAWAIPAAIHGGEEYRNAIFWGQTANRMVDSFAHRRPLWWYLPLLPVLLFPWLVWPGLWKRLLSLRREGLDAGLRFCLAWAVPVFVSFSLISGKQVHYLVPLLPAFALVSGRQLSRASVAGIAFPAVLTSLVAGGMIYLAVAGFPPKLAQWPAPELWPGVLLLLAAVALGWWGRRSERSLPALGLLGATMMAMLHLHVAKSVGTSYDVHPIARQIRSLQEQGVAVANVGRYHAQFQFAGRLAQPLHELNADTIAPWLERNPDGMVVVYVGNAERVQASFSQAYRGGQAVLMSAEQMRAYLAGG